MALASDDPEAQARLAAFRQALQDLGWSAGHNVQFDYRWGVGDFELNRKNAAELVGLAPDVILATGTPTLEPLLRATRTVPIVFVQVPDPVGAGMVESLSRPGGNATGFFNPDYDLAGKWLGLLKEIAPKVTRVALLREPRELGSGVHRRLPPRPLVWSYVRSACPVPLRLSRRSLHLHATRMAA
ncbi:MAG: ABC transporter substrate-binding protein [Xanthobacteraceae bacterium]